MTGNASDVSLTRAAAIWLHRAGSEELPIAVQETAITCILDVLGCCAAARRLPINATLQSFVRSKSEPREAHQWSVGERVPALTAAFGNAVLSHSLIRDDIHVASGSHIGVCVIPAMLALAEQRRLSGRQLLAGVYAGYEAAAWLGSTIRASANFNRHFRPSGITGTFGAAAGACAATGLDIDRSVNALAIAANFSCGLNEWAWSGAHEPFLHAGVAASNGLVAFDLASHGLQASETTLEGADGVFGAYSSVVVASEVANDWCWDRRRPEILQVRHKPVAGCNFIQTPVAAALRLRAYIADPARIRRISIVTFNEARDYPGCNARGPFSSIEQAKMSLQYSVSAALKFGRVDEAAYASFTDVRLLELAALCEVKVDAEFNERFPSRQSAAIEVELADGQRVREVLEDVPWLSKEAVAARAMEDLRAACDDSTALRIRDAVEALNTLPSTLKLFEALGVAVR